MIHPCTPCPLSQITLDHARPLSENWGWLHLTWWWNPPPYRSMANGEDNTITRWKLPVDPQDAIMGTTAQTPGLWHPGRDLATGPDGKLYGLDFLPKRGENDR